VKKRYDVPLGRVVWEVVEEADPQQDVLTSYVFRSSWAYYGPRDRKQYSTRAKAQVAAAKIVLAGGKATVVEKRLNDFSGWKR